PGVVSDEVTVVATSVQVQTAEASLGNVLDTKPFKGRSSIGLGSNTLPSDASAVCTWTLVATTVTSSETTPGASVTSMVSGSPTCNSFPELENFLKPCMVTETVYFPSGTASKEYWPDALADAVLFRPVSS